MFENTYLCEPSCIAYPVGYQNKLELGESILTANVSMRITEIAKSV